MFQLGTPKVVDKIAALPWNTGVLPLQGLALWAICSCCWTAGLGHFFNCIEVFQIHLGHDDDGDDGGDDDSDSDSDDRDHDDG